MAQDTKIDARPRDLWWFRKNVSCLDACPVKTDAGRYVQLIAEGQLAEAYRVARSPNPIASVCGHACGAPCEDACRRGRIDAPVAIRALKRFVTEQYGPESLSSTALTEILGGDMGRGSTTPGHGEVMSRGPHRQAGAAPVAVVGAGPAGLACAHDLALMGYRVTVFEALPNPGGMLRYGIPVYRLPREIIDAQTAEIAALGVEFRYNSPLGQGYGISDLMAQGYRALFLAVGAARGRTMQLEGGDAAGVINAIEFLFRTNQGQRLEVGRRAAIVGGGLVAIDAARSLVRALIPGLAIAPEEENAIAAGTMRVALDAAREAARRGAVEVTVASLESQGQLPAARSAQGRDELAAAREEGITFMPGWGPRRVLVRDGRVAGLEMVRCLNTLDDSGRFHPQFDETQRTTLAVDSVILAIGQAPDLSFLRPADGLEITPAGTLKVDPLTLATSRPGVFAGGDAAFPPGLLITAAAQGKLAARSIDDYLSGRQPGPPRLHVTVEELPSDSYRMPDRYEQLSRMVPEIPLSRRTGVSEVEERYSADEAHRQAQRCLYCHIHPIYDSSQCILCNRCVDICPEHCLHFVKAAELGDTAPAIEVLPPGATGSAFVYDEEKCIRCGLCAIRCPTSAITMERFQFEERPG